jgi:RNA-directed DNA polymerase
MMHEPEKSDSTIVATKPANKAGRPAAEPVERRAETEGNAGRQSTCRVQDREKRVTGAGPRATSRSDLLLVVKYRR